ncbi:MAG: HDOD domain-containing protein, partial [Methylobacterium sp.]|nr:HDOD domain-containing protein [Methylobacterium sp.]
MRPAASLKADARNIQGSQGLKSLQEWESLFSGRDLPVLDETLQTLRVLSGNMGKVSGGDISGAVLPDPLMTLKVMRMANSGRSSRFAQPVTTIEHSVMLLGMTASFDRMLGVVTLSGALPPHAQAGLARTVARALHAADQARDWAVTRLDLNVDEVQIAAMLQELGEFALWTEIPDEMQRLDAERPGSDREAAAQQLLGFRCDELGLLLSRKWNLPPLIASAFLPSECEAHPRARLVAAARNLSRLAEHGWYDAGINQL